MKKFRPDVKPRPKIAASSWKSNRVWAARGPASMRNPPFRKFPLTSLSETCKNASLLQPPQFPRDVIIYDSVRKQFDHLDYFTPCPSFLNEDELDV
jgi:hypothetical protein